MWRHIIFSAGVASERQDFVRKVGSQWCVFSEAGDKLGCHPTEEEANRQLAAIEAHKHGDSVSYAPPPIWIDAALMRQLCPDCADRMDGMHITRVRLDAMPEAALRGLCDKFGSGEGFRTRCMESSIPVDDKGAFCNWLKAQCLGSTTAGDSKRGDGRPRARVSRTDRALIDRFERTPSGGLRIPAALTRVGVLDYADEAGVITRELRPLEEVCDPASYCTLEDAPVCDLHPPEPVDPKNWQTYARGQARGVHVDSDKIAADVVVQDADLLAKIERRDRVELSAAYTCEIDPMPGVFEGERYDAVQRQIRYNHVAVGPRGWGRAGPEVALRIDSRGAEHMTVKINFNGVEYVSGSAEHVAALMADLTLRTRERDEARGRADGLTTEVASLKKRADEAEMSASSIVFGQKVAQRQALIDDARRVMGDDYSGMHDDGDAKGTAKTDRQIHSDVLRKMGRKVDDDAKVHSDDYVKGAYDAAMVGLAAMEGQRMEPVEGSAMHSSTEEGGQSATGDSRFALVSETRYPGKRGVQIAKTPKRDAAIIAKSEEDDAERIRKDNAEFHSDEARASRFALSK